jgi:type IV pilus assembly protein PilE
MLRKTNAGARQRGMTLIELLIALVIVGILTAVAMPLYSRYQERTFATQVMADLGVCVQALERRYTLEYDYLGAGPGGADTGAPTVCPAVSPPSGTALFNITITAADANSFTLRATPINPGQASQVGVIEIDATGVRRWDKNNDGDFADADEDNWSI